MNLIKHINWTSLYHISEKDHKLNVDVNASLKLDNDSGYYIDLNWDYFIGLKSLSGKKERLIDPYKLNDEIFEELEETVKQDLYNFWI
jgi:hypothetical protein